MITETIAWRTSSFSGGGGNSGNCVEVAPHPSGIAVRDTKDRARTPHLYGRAAWDAFLAAVKAGEFEA